MSTRTVLYWFLFMMEHRRNGVDRMLVKAVFASFLASCIGMATARAIGPHGWGPSVHAACEDAHAEFNGVCSHVRRRLEAPLRGEVRRVMLEQMLCSSRDRKSCKACAAGINADVDVLVQQLEEDVEEWGNSDLARVRDISGAMARSRRLRADPHLREIITRENFQTGFRAHLCGDDIYYPPPCSRFRGKGGARWRWIKISFYT